MSLNDTARNYDGAAGDYEAGRPDYPAALIAALPLGDARVIVDLGAGTGKFTRLMLPHLADGASIIAVEPVAGMAARLDGMQGVQIRQRAASDTGLGDGVADLVTAAQSLHWFDDAASVAEIARILRPGGRLALVWNARDDRVPWVHELSRLADRHAGDTPRHQSGHWRWILADPRFRLDAEVTADNPHRMPRAALFARVFSTSYMANLPDASKQDLRREVTDLLGRHGLGDAARITLPYVSRLYLLTRLRGAQDMQNAAPGGGA